MEAFVSELKDYRVYAIIRDDVRSLVEDSGKPAAQAMHAQSASMKRVYCDKQWGEEWANLYNDWLNQCIGDFGTVIVLKAPIEDIYALSSNVNTIPCGLIHDPTFPILDGKVGTTMPLDTCAWMFGDAVDLEPYLGRYELL
jgi:peptidyl-tRNA hydrolase